MERIIRSYISEKIGEAQNYNSDTRIKPRVEVSGETEEELARGNAELGYVSITARHLLSEDTLPEGEKAIILATAFTRGAERYMQRSMSTPFPDYQMAFKDQAVAYERQAQKLTRAAKRVQKA